MQFYEIFLWEGHCEVNQGALDARMPSGQPFSRDIRVLLVYHYSVLLHTSELAYKYLFIDDQAELRTIKKLWKRFDQYTDEQFQHYIEGGPAHDPVHARIFEVDSVALSALEEMLAINRSVKIRILRKRFIEECFPDIVDFEPSMSTVLRAVRIHNSYKHVDWTHSRRDPVLQVIYLQKMAPIDSEFIVDIDGMVQTPEDFLSRYGWSPSNETCKRAQIELGGVTYAVHAAFTELGFLTNGWKVFTETVTRVQVETFLKSIKDHLPENAYGILDNASNQHAAQLAVEQVFGNRYAYCSPYSPELKPIERAFSLVKAYIRERDETDQAVNDPLGLIEEAFTHYSIEHPGAEKAMNLFKIYRDNHEEWKEVHEAV